MNDYLTVGLRTVIIYLLILLVFRLMGKREVGELSVLDLVIFIMIGEMAALAIENFDKPIMHTVLPMLILMVIQIILALASLKSTKVRKIIDGSPTVIVNKGKIDEAAMKSQRYNFDDLLMQLRAQNILSVSDVEYAILETSGELSVIEKKQVRKSDKTGPFPLILDGELLTSNLKYINKSPEWLMKQIEQKGYTDINLISFCSYIDGQLFIDEK
ncbi:DUF421 domain-containing protein [Peribacillus loiseleuriae]|uniref:Membrane protein n=1 Tax=Peribacillus loiseleuriae TaxID=1679170 RepID=A0A0K9GWS2_9BACI|nr:DUF421 domain-containing protein [Peribacillus loiseleuriae]KMY51073.1 membrane protein [Peribacillus loiseleuriae]